MRKSLLRVCSLLMVLLLFLFTGCKKVDLYEAGIEVTTLIGEMISNDDYVKIMIGENNSDIKIEKARAKDYDTPIKVYNIIPPTFEVYLDLISKKGEINKEDYEKLPTSMKEQLQLVYNFSVIANYLLYETKTNLDSFSAAILYSSFAAYKTKEGKLEQTTVYLYVFETGQPIITIFTPITEKEYSIQGRLFSSSECTTLSGVRTLFEPYGCEVNVVK